MYEELLKQFGDSLAFALIEHRLTAYKAVKLLP